MSTAQSPSDKNLLNNSKALKIKIKKLAIKKTNRVRL